MIELMNVSKHRFTVKHDYKPKPLIVKDAIKAISGLIYVADTPLR